MTASLHTATDTATDTRTAGATPSTGDTDRPLVLVTGGSGLLGSSLVDRLIGSHRVVSLDIDGDPTSPPSVEFICTDLSDAGSVERAIDRVVSQHGPQIASVIHLAAYYDFAGRDSPLYDTITVGGTRRLLDALLDVGAEVEQFVFSSTMLVHEPAPPGTEIDESDPLAPSWPYPESKTATETLLHEHPACARMSMVVARIAGVYDEAGHSPPLTNQIKRIDGRWPTSHFYPAGLDHGQSFVHRDDVVDALARIVDRRAELPGWFPVLVGEPDTVGYGELQDLIGQELHGRSWPTWRIPAALAKLGAWFREQNPLAEEPFIRSWMVDRASDHYDLDVSTAEERLGWRPTHDVRSTIPEMIARLRADRSRWYEVNQLRPPRRILPV